MKKLLMSLFAVACTAVFAGANNLLVTFSTKGPDKYADGKTVLDGECYALVWLAADGSQEIVLTAPIAKDGKCPAVLFQLDEAEAAKYVNGSWGVFLLDTRDFAKDATGKTLAGVDEKGAAKVVNTKAAVGSAFTAAGGQFASAKTSGAVAAGAYDLSNIPTPKVDGIQIVGAKVIVTVKDTVPFVGYTYSVGKNGNDFAVPAGAMSASGDATGEIKLVLPKNADGELIQVETIK